MNQLPGCHLVVRLAFVLCCHFGNEFQECFVLAYFLIHYMLTMVRIAQCLGLDSLRQFVDTLFYIRFPHVLILVPSSTLAYTVLTLLDAFATWSWLCADLVVLDLSLLLLDKFKTLNNYMEDFKTKVRRWPTWWLLYQNCLVLKEKTRALRPRVDEGLKVYLYTKDWELNTISQLQRHFPSTKLHIFFCNKWSFEKIHLCSENKFVIILNNVEILKYLFNLCNKV